MQVILNQDVEKLGQIGDMVEVKRGYARNYLIPRKIAVEATDRNMKALEHKKRVIAARIKKLRSKSEALGEQLQKATVTLYHVVGEEERLFGTVTTMEIAEALMEQGIEVDRRKISIEEPIKRLGEYTVTAKLEAGVSSTIKVVVMAREDSPEA